MKAILVCLNSCTNKVPVQLDWERGGFNACCRRGANTLATPVGGAAINCNVCLIHSLLLRAKRHNGKRNRQPKKAQASQKSGSLIYKLPSVSMLLSVMVLSFPLLLCCPAASSAGEKLGFSVFPVSFISMLFKKWFDVWFVLIKLVSRVYASLFPQFPNRFQRKMQEYMRLNWRMKEERTKLCWTWPMQVGATLSRGLIKILNLRIGILSVEMEFASHRMLNWNWNDRLWNLLICNSNKFSTDMQQNFISPAQKQNRKNDSLRCFACLALNEDLFKITYLSYI